MDSPRIDEVLKQPRLRTLRATILRIVYDNHYKQFSRLSHVVLRGVLERLQISMDDEGENGIKFILQDLRERGYLVFEESRDRDNGRLAIHKIQITHKGRDLVEMNIPADPAVQFE